MTNENSAWHTTNVHNFSPTIFTEKSIGNRIRGFFSQLFLQRDEPNTMTPNTHIHTHRPTVKCKQKILLLVIVFHNHFVIIQNNAYLNPDWEESHWFFNQMLKTIEPDEQGEAESNRDGPNSFTSSDWLVYTQIHFNVNECRQLNIEHINRQNPPNASVSRQQLLSTSGWSQHTHSSAVVTVY